MQQLQLPILPPFYSSKGDYIVFIVKKNLKMINCGNYGVLW